MTIGRRSLFVVVVFSVILLLTGCQTSERPSVTDPSLKPSGVGPLPGSDKQIVIEAVNSTFRPNVIELKLGDEEQAILIHNRDSIAHNFSIPGTPLEKEGGEIPPGKSLDIPNFFGGPGPFREYGPGEYKFLCRFHPDQMTGVVRVVE